MAYNIFDATQVQKAMKKKQETILRNAKKRKNIGPKNLMVGWTDKSGRYTEQGPKVLEAATPAEQRKSGNPTTEKAIKVKEVAKIHEFGLGNHTEVGFIRICKANNRRKWLKYYNKYINKWVVKGDRARFFPLLVHLGDMIARDLRQSVIDADLVDTQRMANSIVVDFKGR